MKPECPLCGGTGDVKSFDEFSRWSDGLAAVEPCPYCCPDQELPGMWERADFMGGAEDEVRP